MYLLKKYKYHPNIYRLDKNYKAITYKFHKGIEITNLHLFVMLSYKISKTSTLLNFQILLLRSYHSRSC